MPEFIFMLTHNDATVPDAVEILTSVRDTGLRHVGFKDVGASPEIQRTLTEIAHEAGLTVHLEVVAVEKADELRAFEAAVAADVDWVLGGTHAMEAADILTGSGIKFAPFPGRIVGHPSELRGSTEEIVEHAVQLAALDHVHGLDLLAYRHRTADPLKLLAAVADAVDVPVVAAGSVTGKAQIDGVGLAGAWAFTIGGAVFDGLLPGPKDVVGQVRTALDLAAAP